MEMQELEVGETQDDSLPTPVKVMGLIALILLLGFVGFIMISFEGEDPKEVKSRELQAEKTPQGPDDHGALRFAWDEKPVTKFSLKRVDTSGDLPDYEVIGISSGDEAQAFVLCPDPMGKEAMFVATQIDGNGVIISHNYLKGETRCFTLEGQSSFPDLRLGGMEDSMTLVLLYENVRYRQLSSKIPLADYPHTVTSLREWVAEHPDTLASDRDVDFEPYADGQGFF